MPAELSIHGSWTQPAGRVRKISKPYGVGLGRVGSDRVKRFSNSHRWNRVGPGRVTIWQIITPQVRSTFTGPDPRGLTPPVNSPDLFQPDPSHASRKTGTYLYGYGIVIGSGRGSCADGEGVCAFGPSGDVSSMTPVFAVNTRKVMTPVFEVNVTRKLHLF